jgi:hypothetical protein
MTRFRLLFLTLVLIAPIVPAASAGDITAGEWMQLPDTSRAMYVIGVLDGVDVVARRFGGGLRQRGDPGGRLMSYHEFADIVYRRLRDDSQLHGMNAAEAIFSALHGHFVLTDRAGRRTE